MRVLPAILANTVLFVAAVGYGSILLRLLPQGFSRVDRFALVLLGGLGLLGTVLFDIGQVWFSRAAIAAIVLPGVLPGLATIIRTLRKLRKGSTKISVPLLPALVVSAVILVSAVGGLAEPIGDMKMDAIAYHFLGPKVWLRDGVIRPALDEAYTAFPAIVETQFAALIAFGGQRAPGFFAVIALLSILLITASVAARTGLNRAGCWWVLALIIAMPPVYRGAYGGFVDVLYSGFVLAAARVGFDAESSRQYLLFGMFCGFAMGTKYTGLIAFALLAVCAFLISRTTLAGGAPIGLKPFGIACAAAAVIAGPWYIRNFKLMGCPIYPPPPLLPWMFHVKYMSSEALQRFHDFIRKVGGGMGRGPLAFLLLPFHLTVHPANFLNGGGGIGLAPLALGPFGFFEVRWERFTKSLLAFSLLQTAAWFVTEQDVRFLIHVLVVAAIFAVWGRNYVVRSARAFGPALSALVMVTSLGYGLFMIVSDTANDVRSVISRSFEDQRRREGIPYLESFHYLNHEPSVTNVLVLEPNVPTYHLDKRYVKPVGRWGEQVFPRINNTEQALAALPALHSSHILDVRWESGAFRVPPGSKGLTLVFQREDQRIYRVD